MADMDQQYWGNDHTIISKIEMLQNDDKNEPKQECNAVIWESIWLKRQ